MLVTQPWLDMPSMRTAYRNVNGIVDILGIVSYRGFMETEKDPRIITPIPRALLQAIDDYRFDQRLASRAEAIRQLIDLGLKAVEKDQKSRKS